MKEHTNRIWWKTRNDGYSTYEVVSETTVDGYDMALLKKFTKSTNFTRFNMLVDLSKYRKCWEKVFYSSDECQRGLIMGFHVYLGDLKKNVYFSMKNSSPSTWDNEFGQGYYIESEIYEQQKNKSDSMKDMIRTGVNEKNIIQYTESMAMDVVRGMKQMIDCLESCGAPLLTPENEF